MNKTINKTMNSLTKTFTRKVLLLITIALTALVGYHIFYPSPAAESDCAVMIATKGVAAKVAGIFEEQKEEKTIKKSFVEIAKSAATKKNAGIAVAIAGAVAVIYKFVYPIICSYFNN